jgi:hypothetical protein
VKKCDSVHCTEAGIEGLMKEALAEVGDFKIGVKIINKVRFADDTAIITKTQ